MDARLVWQTWRRILSSDELVQAAVKPREDAPPPPSLAPDERAVLAEYARTPAATDVTVTMYRRGLVRNTRAALNLVPLTRRLLLASGVDLPTVSAELARSIELRDHGPNFWRVAADFVAFLARHPVFAAPERQDALAVEAAAIALVRRLGEVLPAVWPDEAAAAPSPREGERYIASRAAAVVASEHDLTPWLEAPAEFAIDAALERSRCYWLVYVPNAEDAHTYAELSERAARAFALLAEPRTAAELSAALDGVPPDEALKVLASLAALGAVSRAEGTAQAARPSQSGPSSAPLSSTSPPPSASQSSPHASTNPLAPQASASPSSTSRPDAPRSPASRTPPTPPLDDGAYVMLDPAVEVLETMFRGASLLCHTELEAGMVVPPGEGLLDFVHSLAGAPTRVGDLRAGYSDHSLVDEMLASLVSRGFAHVSATAEAPPPEALARLRDAARARLASTQRRAVDIDLDRETNAAAVLEIWSAAAPPQAPAPEVLLRCARLADREALLAELAHRRHSGALRAHHVVVRTSDARCTEEARTALGRLNAAVELDGIPWPAPEAPPTGLAELAGARIAVHALVTPDASLLDASARERAIAWLRRSHVTGLCLRLDETALWGPAAAADHAAASLTTAAPAAPPTDAQLEHVLDAIRALEDALADAVAVDMPSDEVLLGHTARGPLPALSDTARRLRRAYVRRRVATLAGTEGTNVWSQIPEAEDKWVRLAEDLLPNNPALLGLAPGRTLVDIAGGLGRVARRLAPAVGPDGLVISIEMRRFLTEQARRFACEGGLPHLQFRVGLAERLPLPDACADAAVNEWTGAIWELGLGPAMVKEMARVVRPGGRVAVTHRLVRLRLAALGQPWVQYEQIYGWVRSAFRIPELAVVEERVWGQTVQPLVGEPTDQWVERYLPRLVAPDDGVFHPEDAGGDAPRADVFLTMIAERTRA